MSPTVQLLKGQCLLSDHAALALGAADGPRRTGKHRLIGWPSPRSLLMALRQQHARLLSHGGLFDLDLMAEALYNYKEIRTLTGLKCGYLSWTAGGGVLFVLKPVQPRVSWSSVLRPFVGPPRWMVSGC